MPVSPEMQREMLRQMQTIRRFEERASDDLLAGDIYGVVHCYIGEEAIAVGVCSALNRDDRIISTHRGHGHCIAKGADLNRMMAELYGRETGYCKGKVAVSFFGDGASNAGPFHESINIAASWKLPMIYVCENNLWAAQTPAATTTALPDIAARAAGYGIPGVIVDGNDVVAVHEAAVEAVARARAGEGPSLIECKSYRWRKHTERPEQPDRRPEDEVEHWKTGDPIVRLVESLKTQQGQLTEEEWQAMDADILEQIEASVRFAKASPFPKPEAALEDVFAQ